MKPLIVLLVVFGLAIVVFKLVSGEYNLVLSGRIAMAVMLLFTAIAHFKFNQGMAMMLPEFLPYRSVMVYFTGIVELVAAVGLLLPGFSVFTGWLLIVFFILILPANIYAALHNVDYQNGTFNGEDRFTCGSGFPYKFSLSYGSTGVP